MYLKAVPTLIVDQSSFIFEGGSMYVYDQVSHLNDRFNKKMMLTAETNLRISSITMTGALITNTAFHSSQLRGVMANNF